jgi:hypothetical protein
VLAQRCTRVPSAPAPRAHRGRLLHQRRRVSLVEYAESLPIAGDDHDGTKLDALIRLEIACRLALNALPELPAETETALRAHVERLCEVTRRELDRINPGWREKPAV